MSGEGVVWISTDETLERLLRQVRLSTADHITLDRNQLEGVLFELSQFRKGNEPLRAKTLEIALARLESGDLYYASVATEAINRHGLTVCRHGVKLDIQCVDCALSDDDSTAQRNCEGK